MRVPAWGYERFTRIDGDTRRRAREGAQRQRKPDNRDKGSRRKGRVPGACMPDPHRRARDNLSPSCHRERQAWAGSGQGSRVTEWDPYMSITVLGPVMGIPNLSLTQLDAANPS